jgi:hypothetical protein
VALRGFRWAVSDDAAAPGTSAVKDTRVRSLRCR